MKIQWTSSARLDVDQIYKFIAEGSPRSAAGVEDRIFEATESLGPFPQKGRRGRIEGTHEWVVSRTPYLIIDEALEDQVSILRVVHGSQLWPPAEDG